MKKGILIQARMSSRRFPGKMLGLINGVALIDFVYKRCLRSGRSDVVAVITSTHQSDDDLYIHCEKENIPVWRGSLSNVLSRYIESAKFFDLGVICRVCGDSPLVDTEIIDEMLQIREEERLDYVTLNKDNCLAGLDSEVFTVDALKRLANNHLSEEELEHVTLGIKNNTPSFKTKFINKDLRPFALKDVSLTVDSPGDLLLCNEIVKFLVWDNYNFSSSDILKILLENKPVLNLA